MKKRVFFPAILFAIFLVSCASAPASPQATIVAPIECRVKTNGEIPLSITGYLPSGATIKWEVTAGSVTPDDTTSVIFKAPDVSGNVLITARIRSGGDYSITYACQVEADSSLEIPLSSPTADADSHGSPLSPKDSVSPSSLSNPENPSIAITEIMNNPCGGIEEESANEYVELYNYGNVPINVSGWFLAITRDDGDSKKIVPWQTRYPNNQFGADLIFDSGMISPGAYAVVLSPLYSMSKSDHIMPYAFPKGTVILTVDQGKRIGSEMNGILSSDASADGVFLYQGTRAKVDQLVSTYGVESVGMEPGIVQRKKGLPYHTSDCASVQRKIASGEDIPENWEIIPAGNPGTGPE